MDDDISERRDIKAGNVREFFRLYFDYKLTVIVYVVLCVVYLKKNIYIMYNHDIHVKQSDNKIIKNNSQ